MRFQKIGSLSLITLTITLLVGGFSTAALSQNQPDSLSQPDGLSWDAVVKAIANNSPSSNNSYSPSTKQDLSNEEILLETEGALEDNDLVLPQDGSFYDEHTFEGRAGQPVAIDLESSDFDTFLILFDPQGQVVGQHDDISQDNLNSTLNVTLPADGTYTVVANGFDSNSKGQYRLTIRTPTQP